MIFTVKKILFLFNRNEKKKLLVLFLMMIIAALFETLGIGLIVPFVGIITNPTIVKEQIILSNVYDFFNFNSILSFTIFSVIILLIVFMLKNLYLLLFNYLQFRLILNQQVKLAQKLFKEYLTKPYSFHLQRNSSDLLRNVNEEVPKVFQGIIISVFQLSTEILVTICILVLLLASAPLATITSMFLLGSSVFLFFKFFRKKITSLGKEQQIVSGKVIKWINQGLGASKEVKVYGRESFFINAYTSQSQTKANNSRYMKMLEQFPRLFIETLLVTIVLLTMLIIVFQGTDTSKIVSTMALFTMAAFRLMPSITRIVSLTTTIRYSLPALSVIHKDLHVDKSMKNININQEQKLLDGGKKSFSQSIRLENVSFRYPNQTEYTVKDLTLTIGIGESVAFIGESGAGKSTVVDIILGLLNPDKGRVLVDDTQLSLIKTLWQKKIGYIPQSIYLSDDTIRANVAFGIEQQEVNDEAVWKALEQANLKEFVEKLPGRLETKVGERGVCLSGGQRQRIGIARALYHDPEIIFMDEATSALDNETEGEIMKAIDSLKGRKTLIIIAHRLTTIKNCDVVFRVKKGRIVETEKTLKIM